ncbi:TetR family transcriptional regulator C-terminal domain-containing protein [Streptomyces violaceusniger]
MSSPAAGRTAGQVVDGPPSRQRPRPPGRGRYVRLMAENTASDTERRGCLLAKGAAELAQHDPTVAGRSAETMRALLTLLRTEISAAQRHGDIDSAADPERLAALLLTVVRGIEAVGKARPGPGDAAEHCRHRTGGPAHARGAETPRNRAQSGPRELTWCHHGHMSAGQCLASSACTVRRYWYRNPRAATRPPSNASQRPLRRSRSVTSG